MASQKLSQNFRGLSLHQARWKDCDRPLCDVNLFFLILTGRRYILQSQWQSDSAVFNSLKNNSTGGASSCCLGPAAVAGGRFNQPMLLIAPHIISSSVYICIQYKGWCMTVDYIFFPITITMRCLEVATQIWHFISIERSFPKMAARNSLLPVCNQRKLFKTSRLSIF